MYLREHKSIYSLDCCPMFKHRFLDWMHFPPLIVNVLRTPKNTVKHLRWKQRLAPGEVLFTRRNESAVLQKGGAKLQLLQLLLSLRFVLWLFKLNTGRIGSSECGTRNPLSGVFTPNSGLDPLVSCRVSHGISLTSGPSGWPLDYPAVRAGRREQKTAGRPSDCCHSPLKNPIT